MQVRDYCDEPERGDGGGAMSINPVMLDQLQDYMVDFMEGCGPDDEWMLRHTTVVLEDFSHTVTIAIDNMNEQDYEAWRRAAQ
jgi:hypothetical protein